MNRVRCRRGRCLLSQGPQLQLHVTVLYSAQQCTVQESGTAPQPGKKRRRTQGQSSTHRQTTRCVYIRGQAADSVHEDAPREARYCTTVPPTRPGILKSPPNPSLSKSTSRPASRVHVYMQLPRSTRTAKAHMHARIQLFHL